MQCRLHLVIGLLLFCTGSLSAQLATLGRGRQCDPNSEYCTTMPRITYSPAPEYSDEARMANREGTCTLTLVVKVDGHVSDVNVASGLGMGLDEKAIETVKKWRFSPATRKGKPVPMKIAVDIDFHCKSTCSATVPRSDLVN